MQNTEIRFFILNSEFFILHFGLRIPPTAAGPPAGSLTTEEVRAQTQVKAKVAPER